MMTTGNANGTPCMSQSDRTLHSFSSTSASPNKPWKNYDYLLKFLFVGDADCGKDEIMNSLGEGRDSSFASRSEVQCKTTSILLEGRWVKLELWDTSGQGRFGTIIRNYSRGAQGVLLVYDITNKWSFEAIGRWLKEVDQQAPGVPKILIGNRLHLEFKRAVSRTVAEKFAAKHHLEYFEVSSLADFNIHESLVELSRLVLSRNGMQRQLKPNKLLSLQALSCRCIVGNLRTVYAIDQLPLPISLRLTLRSFANSALLIASNTLPASHRSRHASAKHSRTPSDNIFVSCLSSQNTTDDAVASSSRHSPAPQAYASNVHNSSTSSGCAKANVGCHRRFVANNGGVRKNEHCIKQSCKRVIAFCGGATSASTNASIRAVEIVEASSSLPPPNDEAESVAAGGSQCAASKQAASLVAAKDSVSLRTTPPSAGSPSCRNDRIVPRRHTLHSFAETNDAKICTLM